MSSKNKKNRKGTTHSLPPKPSNCESCSKADSTDDMVQCGLCDLWHHYACVGVTSDVRSKNFACPKCKIISETLPSNIPQSQTEVENTLLVTMPCKYWCRLKKHRVCRTCKHQCRFKKRIYYLSCEHRCYTKTDHSYLSSKHRYLFKKHYFVRVPRATTPCGEHYVFLFNKCRSV